jgi:hypothetical protein
MFSSTCVPSAMFKMACFSSSAKGFSVLVLPNLASSRDRVGAGRIPGGGCTDCMRVYIINNYIDDPIGQLFSVSFTELRSFHESSMVRR